MTSQQLRQGRLDTGLTQVQAAAGLGVSQPYLSLLETGRRPVTRRVARAAARLYRLPPTMLPLPREPVSGSGLDRLARELSALGYPRYRHLRAASAVNPAALLLKALSESSLDARVAQALPWVLMRYPELDWDWLVSSAKLRNVQNGLGFAVALARELAEGRPGQSDAVPRLAKAEQELERARLAAETTLGREGMPAAEREWLRAHRSPLARHWNVLSSLTSGQLADVS